MARRASRKETERKAADIKQQRLAYVGTLAAGLAHEIRNPLNSINMNVELIMEDLSSENQPGAPGNVVADKDVLLRLSRISEETRQLQNVLEEFLNFARPPKMELMVTDINQYLDDLLSFFEPECIQADVQILREFAEKLYPVRIDPAQLKHAIVNLIKNAIEAIGEHGQIVVSTRDHQRSVQIVVSDNGGGLNQEDENRIFEVFFSRKEQGIGLGLAIARRIVEEHKGTLTLENRPGKGASFVLTLPKGIFLEFEEGTEGALQK
jgi:signal transduction histidine kinase